MKQLIPDSGLQLYTGSANPELAQSVADHLGYPLGRSRPHQFSDGESHFQVEESIRGQDIFIVQPTAPPVNETLMELLIMLDTFKRSSAGRITAILPYFGYSRQEKKTTGREPITTRLVADLLTTAGADRVVSLDLHNPAIQGFFNIGMDHLTAVPILANYLNQHKDSKTVIVSPDAGRVKLADKYAELLNVPLVVMHKRRTAEGVNVRAIVGEVEGMRPIVIDDMIATGGTICKSVQALVEAGAMPEITVACTHPIFSGPALQNLTEPSIAKIVTTDTIRIAPEKKLPKIEVLSVAPLLADTIKRLHNNESISAMFGAHHLQPV